MRKSLVLSFAAVIILSFLGDLFAAGPSFEEKTTTISITNSKARKIKTVPSFSAIDITGDDRDAGFVTVSDDLAVQSNTTYKLQMKRDSFATLPVAGKLDSDGSSSGTSSGFVVLTEVLQDVLTGANKKGGSLNHPADVKFTVDWDSPLIETAVNVVITYKILAEA